MAAASSSVTSAATEGTRSSIITLPKRGLRSLKKTVHPLLEKLGDGACKVLDITHSLATNKFELDSLAQRVREVTEDIIQQARDSPEAERLLVMEVGRVQSVIDEIVAFLVEQNEREAARSTALLARQDEVTNEIVKYKSRLKDVMDLLTTNLTMKMFSKMNIDSSLLRDSMHSSSFGLEARDQGPSHFPALHLPPQPRIFHGRGAVASQLKMTLLQDECARLAILGTAGIGKTTMAAVMLYDGDIEAKFGTRRIFIRCEAITSADGIVSGLADALKLTTDNRSDLLRSVVQYLRNTEAPVLLVLDNFETPWDSADQDAVEEILGHLDTVKNLSFMVTMRGTKRPGGIKWSQPVLPSLEPVDLPAARTIYSANGGRDGRRLDHLLELLDGLPLAIVLLAYHGQTRSPVKLAAAYKAERADLLNRGRRTRLTSLEVSISFTLNCQTMRDEPNALEALRLLSLLPDGIDDAEIPGVFPNLARRGRAIRTLQDVALLSCYGSRYKVLAPIRECIQATQEPAGPLLLDMRNYYYAIPVQLTGWVRNRQHSVIFQRIRQAYGNIRAIMMHALSRSELSRYLFSALKYLSLVAQMGVHSGDCLQLLNAALGAVQRVPAFKGELYSIWKMKSLSHQLRLEREAAAAADVAADALEEAGGGGFELQVMGSGLPTQPDNAFILAKWHEKNGDLQEAARLYTLARNGYETRRDEIGAAICTQSLGTICEAQGKLEESYELYAESKRTFIEEGQELCANFSTSRMAEVQRMRRNFGEAIPLYLEAASCSRSLGLVPLVAAAELARAICYGHLNMHSRAASALVAAQAEWETLKDYNQVANCMRDRASYYCTLGWHDDEHATIHAAIDYCKRNGLDERVETFREQSTGCNLSQRAGSAGSGHDEGSVL
ncbi:hypothetical protein CALVIDRAFT_602986 [Calocera viscosa TUFC12733]|uniref:ORC1/DEAH AAA+ ATPase domain-containing protein n=1 Tax=Calocera viscosa (strain TUFC12733) TaxID=1330018 RepID=A0A167GC16_CALVF|nr:hypothetical protein CALVIDRAFT_602986 [Calocera viscosa TUFC12733]